MRTGAISANDAETLLEDVSEVRSWSGNAYVTRARETLHGRYSGGEIPGRAPYIREAVEEHGEEWVIENYFPQIASLGVVMAIPSIEELPFFDKERHETPTEEEIRERAEAYRAYRENLRTGTKPGSE